MRLSIVIPCYNEESVLVETVRQLQGKAGKAQVPGVRHAVETCGGGAFMDVHFSVLSNQLLS